MKCKMPSWNQTNEPSEKTFAILANLGLNCGSVWPIISMGYEAHEHVLLYIEPVVTESVDRAVVILMLKQTTPGVPEGSPNNDILI